MTASADERYAAGLQGLREAIASWDEEENRLVAQVTDWAIEESGHKAWFLNHIPPRHTVASVMVALCIVELMRKGWDDEYEAHLDGCDVDGQCFDSAFFAGYGACLDAVTAAFAGFALGIEDKKVMEENLDDDSIWNQFFADPKTSLGDLSVDRPHPGNLCETDTEPEVEGTDGD